MNQELQAHSSTLLDKINYQEGVIAELEDKNRRLTDLLNTHLYDRAQTYKEAVLSKLSQKSASRGGGLNASMQGPPPTMTAMSHGLHTRNRSITPEPLERRN